MPIEQRLEAVFAAPPIPRAARAGQLDESSDDESVLAPVALANNRIGRNGRGAYGRTENRVAPGPVDNEPNPLQEDRQERIPLPTQFWGEPVIEEAYTNCLLLWESQGWPIFRNKTRYLEQNRLSLFGPNGPLSG